MKNFRIISCELRATNDKLRAYVVAALLFVMGVNTAMAQEINKESRTYHVKWELSDLFGSLRMNFPQTYLVRQTNDWIIYDLNYWFTDKDDKQKCRQYFDRIFDNMDKRLKPLRKFTESID